MTDMHELTALEQAAAMRSGEMGVVELTRACLARIEALNPEVGAFVTVAPETALAAARGAERALRDGAAVSALHGVCTAIKDLNFVAGIPASFGSAAFPDIVPPFDDNVTALVRRSGMIITGKTSTAELGAACYTETKVAPPARTPWDTTMSAGGSSGGSGAAVGTGLVPLAHGSDSAGSVRIPASVCGVVGLKPSRGRISSGPASGETTGLFANGVLGRSTLDVAAMLDVLAVPMPGDPFALPRPSRSFLEQARSDDHPLRIGRFATPSVPNTPVAGECMRAWEDVSALLESLGHEVEDLDNPFPPETSHLFRTMFSVMGATVPLESHQVELLQPLTAWLRDQGENVKAVELTRAVTAAQQIGRGAAAAFAHVDVVLTPTLAQPPVKVGHFREQADGPADEFASQARFNPFAPLYNLTGQPALSVPAHWTDDGLPIGVMLAGRSGAEGVLLRLANQLERQLSWMHRRPPVW